MLRFPIRLLPCLLPILLILNACGDVPATPVARNITVQDNGQVVSYTATTTFVPTLMSPDDLTHMEREMFDAINAERQKGGSCYDPVSGQTVTNPPVSPLILERDIHTAAQTHANAMVQDNFEGHINPYDESIRTPTKRMVKAGYKPMAPLDSTGQSLFFEESLAYGYLTPAEVIDAWEKESFSHCMTIYVPLTYGAVAVQDGLPNDKYLRYWVLNVSGVMNNQ